MIRITSVALAAAAVLALPAAGHAAETFGSRLNQNPANANECETLMAPCTIASYIHPSDPNGDPYSGGAPSDGVITKFRIRAYGNNGPASVTFRVAEVTPNPADNGAATGRAVGTGPTVTVPAYDGGQDTPILEFAGRVPVKKGDHLALDGTNVAATHNSGGDKYSYAFAPTLVDGQAARGSNVATGELLVAAVIEPDADRDGFGDETQDQCQGSPASAPPCVGGPADKTKPRLSGLKLTRKALTYRLSEAAKVTVRIKKGRRTVRTLTSNGKAGRNRLKIKGRKLGRFSVVVSAQDPAGNKSAPKRIKLRVKR